MQLSHLLSQVNAKSHAGSTATTRNEPTDPASRGEEAQFAASLHSAMDDTSDTQLKTKSQLKSELDGEEALKKEPFKKDGAKAAISSDEVSIEIQAPSAVLLGKNTTTKSAASNDSQALLAPDEAGEKSQTSSLSVSPSSIEGSSDPQTVAQSMDEGLDVLQQLQQSHSQLNSQLRSKKVLTDQQHAKLGTESVSTEDGGDALQQLQQSHGQLHGQLHSKEVFTDQQDVKLDAESVSTEDGGDALQQLQQSHGQLHGQLHSKEVFTDQQDVKLDAKSVSTEDGGDALQQLQQSHGQLHGQLRSKKELTDQQDVKLDTESVSTDVGTAHDTTAPLTARIDTDTIAASTSTATRNANGDKVLLASKLASTDEVELKHHRSIDTELDSHEFKTTVSGGKESTKELLESQQNKSVHGQNALLTSKAELLPQGDAVKASINHSAALSQAQTQSLLDQSHATDSKEASAQAALQSLSAHQNGASSASSLLGNRQDTSLNNQPPLLLTKEQAGDQLADKVQMMAAKNLKQIDIRLDPPELGRMQIKLSLHDDNQASIQFQVAHQQTRDLIDQAMPRLRELLLQQGMQLAQSSVHQETSQQFSQHFNQQSGQDSSAFGSGGHSDGSHDGHDDGTVIEGYVTTSSDRVDYYA
ncbi:flagellar hook-length control protein FliK [Photobacterium damselae]|uniref:flagellar hook-length control protein FliK n=1 Tax=Photobacterium damselae TaxID=38293 RepID=UPI001EFE36B2|nr:flagellar hook-length control protein FliK [Photobacterium damselae]MCG9703629.1 flagellar hook-length control protein FliK [Photobacterium damselae]